MATATHHSTYHFAWIAFIALLLSACSSPQERYEQALQQAIELRVQGNTEAALQRLEKLAAENPDDLRVLVEMARAYADQGDATTAAFFMAEAARQSPDDTELLLEAYQAQLAAGEQARATELVLLMEELAPEALGPDEWLLVGAARADQNRARSALEAYLRAVRLNNGEAESETALEIGRLFIQVENYPQAERWLRRAAEDEITELPARFSLMEVYFNQSAWGQAEQEMEILDERFPGAIEGSQWAEARAELERWQSARAEAARVAAEQIAAIQLPGAETVEEETAPAVEGEAVAEAPAEDTPTTIDPATRVEDAPAAATPAADTSETAAATPPPSIKLADADEPAPAEPTDAAEESAALEQDPRITIQPTDPLDGLVVTFDGAGDDSIVFESDPSAIAPAPEITLSLPERAQQAAADGNTEEAIRLYWRALGENPEEPVLWQRLSDLYLVEGQLRNAETTILEAIRLAPQSIGLTLQHLRIQQRLLDPQSFVRAVERAADRFPRSADIALSLARAYDRVLNDSVAAQRQYRRFIELDPDHPMRDEAEAAIRRLF
jgi:tetratricopeptide (TPR) repeat protein